MLSVINAVAGRQLSFLQQIFQLIILWPGIAVLVKRIHDRNKSGALVWLLYGPSILALMFTIAAVVGAAADHEDAAATLGVIAAVSWLVVLGIGICFFIEFGCLRGTVGANRYGPDPVSSR